MAHDYRHLTIEAPDFGAVELPERAAPELEQQAETACPGFLAWIRDPVLRPPPWGTGPIPQGWPGAAVVR